MTRTRQLAQPTQLAEVLYRGAVPLIEKEATENKSTTFRLIGIGASKLVDGEEADRPDLINQGQEQDIQIEQTIDRVREKFGSAALGKGRGFKPQPKK